MTDNERIHELKEENKELLGFTYDSNTYRTRDINTLFKDRKGICFDFVNYLYHKYNKKVSVILCGLITSKETHIQFM